MGSAADLGAQREEDLADRTEGESERSGYSRQNETSDVGVSSKRVNLLNSDIPWSEEECRSTPSDVKWGLWVP